MADYAIPDAEREKLAGIAGRFGRGERTALSGLWGSSAALVVSAFSDIAGGVIAAVAPDEQEAADFREDLEFFLGGEVPLYPAFDPRTARGAEARLADSERLAILSRLLSGAAPPIVVMPVSALLSPVPSLQDLEKATMQFAPGIKSDPQALRSALEDAGFEHCPLVTAPGEFSLRGDIVDVFPMAAARPYRLEFFDDEL